MEKGRWFATALPSKRIQEAVLFAPFGLGFAPPFLLLPIGTNLGLVQFFKIVATFATRSKRTLSKDLLAYADQSGSAFRAGRRI